jgi:hypothetical protein
MARILIAREDIVRTKEFPRSIGETRSGVRVRKLQLHVIPEHVPPSLHGSPLDIGSPHVWQYMDPWQTWKASGQVEAPASLQSQLVLNASRPGGKSSRQLSPFCTQY